MTPVDLIVCPVMAMPAVKLGGSNAPGYGDTYNEPHSLAAARVVERALGGWKPAPAFA